MSRQKYVSCTKSGDMWLLDRDAGPSYLAAQCRGQSGLEKDLEDGWIVRWVWEDRYMIVFLLERA